jgi:heterodisulfide reductase subunit A-like polyferredoxin
MNDNGQNQREIANISKTTLVCCFSAQYYSNTIFEDMAPIIIIGAGLVGLTLAQALKKAGFEFEFYDRDSSLEERPAGWGITMHWALSALESCLPADVFRQLLSIQVNPAEGGKGSNILQLFGHLH